jgi:predicted dithiol-disulfide oxidoreductase (DUF899 family)
MSLGRHMQVETGPKNIVSHEDWIVARKQLWVEEKELTRSRDRLSALRRSLPWEAVEKDYRFEGTSGEQTLSEVFEGRSQLIVYHMMGVGRAGETPCRFCSFWADSFSGIFPHLNDRDVTLAVISQAPISELQQFAVRVGWEFPILSDTSRAFSFDYEVAFRREQLQDGTTDYNYGTGQWPAPEAPGVSVFAKDPGGKIFHTYSCYSRGLDTLNNAFQYLDLVPKGRNEDGLGFSLSWVRYRDEYSRPQPTAGS